MRVASEPSDFELHGSVRGGVIFNANDFRKSGANINDGKGVEGDDTKVGNGDFPRTNEVDSNFFPGNGSVNTGRKVTVTKADMFGTLAGVASRHKSFDGSLEIGNPKMGAESFDEPSDAGMAESNVTPRDGSVEEGGRNDDAKGGRRMKTADQIDAMEVVSLKFGLVEEFEGRSMGLLGSTDGRKSERETVDIVRAVEEAFMKGKIRRDGAKRKAA